MTSPATASSLSAVYMMRQNMSNIPKYNVVITTAANAGDAETLARLLLEKKLAACVQVYPIKSYYTWKGDVKSDDEHILLVKAKAADYSTIEATIKDKSTYDVPEVVQVPITNGSSAYLAWIDEVTR
ncbi:MAG: divalent-cation tolerance protein CutA [Vulcanimicrobiaceae bacterium]